MLDDSEHQKEAHQESEKIFQLAELSSQGLTGEYVTEKLNEGKPIPRRPCTFARDSLRHI